MAGSSAAATARNPYELFLQLEGIIHKRTRVSRPQSNGIVERLHRTLLDEHFRVEGHRTWFETIEEMQGALDACLVTYNTRRPHQGRGINRRSPDKAFVQGIPKCKQKGGTYQPEIHRLIARARSGNCQAIPLSTHRNAELLQRITLR